MQKLNSPAITVARTRRRMTIAVLGLGCVLAGLAARGILYQQANVPIDRSIPKRQGRNAPFITTPDRVLDAMIELAQLDEDDLVYDLGCGDGRIVITAALKSGCRGIGFDIDPKRVAEARANVKLHGLEDRVKIVQRDLFTVDLSEADVSMMYLLPWMVNKLLLQFEQMKPGCRIVSHDFWIDGVRPDKFIECPNQQDNAIQTVYLYTTPLEHSRTMEPGKPPVPADLTQRSVDYVGTVEDSPKPSK